MAHRIRSVRSRKRTTTRTTRRRHTRKRTYGGKTLKQVVNAREVGMMKAEISSKKAEAARFSWMRRHGLA